MCRCSPCCSCTAVISVISLTHRHDRVEELSETRQCADKTCHIHRGQQCSNHQQHTIGRCRQHSECSGTTVGDLSATMMSGSGVDAAAVARYTAPSRRRDDATTRSHRSQRRVHTALACTSDAPSVLPLQHDSRGCRVIERRTCRISAPLSPSVQPTTATVVTRAAATADSHGASLYLIWGIYSAGRTEKVSAARDSFYRSHTPLPLHFVHVNTTHLSL